jgi:predicted Zn finger-like uncharacterized protein
MEKVTCDKCKSEYEIVESVRLPARSSDTIECEVCGNTIYSYNDTQQYNGKLIKRASWPPKRAPN